jgi:hypothetical protein
MGFRNILIQQHPGLNENKEILFYKFFLLISGRPAGPRPYIKKILIQKAIDIPQIAKKVL